MATVTGTRRLLDISGNNISTAVSLEAEGTLLDSNGQSGTSNQVLISTATGVDWVDGSGSSIIGGPYVPLSGGFSTGQAMTGTLYGPGATFSVAGNNSTNLKVGDGSFRMEMGRSSIQARVVGVSGAASSLNLNPNGGDVLFPGSGNVGIGTTSPSTKLQISSTMSSTPTSNIFLDVDGSNVNGGGGSIIFNTSASAGTASGYNAKITGTREGGGTGGDSRLGFWTTLVSSSTAPQERMTITKEGNVGIGTTSPSRNLHVHADSGNAYLQLTQAATGTTSNDGFQISMGAAQVNFINRENGNMVFETNNTEKMRITSSGNVGIGTTSPGSKLEVSSGVGANGDSILTISADTDNSTSSSSPKLLMLQKGSTKTSLIEMDSSDRTHFSNATGYYFSGGNVGIGTTNPTADLHIQGATATDVPVLRVGGFGNSGSKLELAETLTSGDMNYGFSFFNDGNGSNTLMIKAHNNSTTGITAITINRTNSLTTFSTVPVVGTRSAGDNTTRAASTAFVTAAITGSLGNYLLNTTDLFTGALTIDGELEMANGPNGIIYTTDDILTLSSGGKTGGTDIVLDDGASVIKLNSDTIARDQFRVSSSTDGTGDDVFIANSANGTFTLGDIEGLGDEAFIQGDASNIKIRNSSADSLVADSNNNVSIPNGNLIVPDQIIHTGDTNTYMQFHAADQWRVVTGGSERLEVNNSATKVNSGNFIVNQKIAIGHSSPGAELDIVAGTNSAGFKVVGTSTSYTAGFIANTGSGNAGVYYDASNGDFSGSDYGFIGQNNSGYMEYNIGTSSSLPYHVFTGGNVGVGLTSPDSTLTVFRAVSSYAVSRVDVSTRAGLSVKSSSNYDSKLNFATGLNSQQYIQGLNNAATTGRPIVLNPYGGYVGINTANVPTQQLDIISGTNNGIRISATDNQTWRDIGIRSYVTEGQANALADHTFIYTTNPSSGTEDPFGKFGATVIQGRDNGNSGFAIRLGNGGGHATRMWMGGTGATTFSNTVTATNFILSSDERLKENIGEVCDNRVKADWKTFELKTEKGQKRYGVIAQELEKTNPEFIREDSKGFKSVAYIDLLIAKIAELEARLEKLEK